MTRHPIRAFGAAAASLMLAGCGQFFPDAPPPPHLSLAAGPAWAAAVRYADTHPLHLGSGWQAGILVRSQTVSSDFTCSTWQGIAVVSGGRAEQLISYDCDNAMGQLVHLGDYFRFPSRGDVNAPDDYVPGPASVIVPGAVSIP